MTDATFSLASCEEIWQRGSLIERRLEHGEARQSGREILASDAPDHDLLAARDRRLEPLREIARVIRHGSVRLVIRAIRERGDLQIEEALILTIDGASIVTDESHARTDLALLDAIARPPEIVAPRGLPILWRNGAAAVVLHEAAGHPAEHACAPLAWPSWLRVEDVSGAGRADLLAAEMPRAMRRESFRDVPLHRMTSVIAAQHHAPFELPDERIEVHFVAHGAFDPLDDSVSVGVAIATHVVRDKAVRIAPFSVHTSCAHVAKALRGASGPPLRYPGVICSSEGQELVVASAAPLMITGDLV